MGSARADCIAAVEAFSIRLARDTDAARGTAGSPTALAGGAFDYRWSETCPALYSDRFEAALVRVGLESGLVGWGEAQAPLAPGVACLIVEELLRPAIVGEAFEPTARRIAALRERMYATMRVRGQTGGFMLDAMAAVDLALWDLAGKATGRPVAELIGGGSHRRRIPAYLSGLGGGPNPERVARAREAWTRGFRTFKLFHDRDAADLCRLLDGLREALGPEAEIAVDALWRLDAATAAEFGRQLDHRRALWLECPLWPESVLAHAELAAAIRTPLALGESYRSRREMRPFLQRRCLGWLQPDLGRWGLTEAVRLAAGLDPNLRIAPHISIAMGPQIAAALHFAAGTPTVRLAEYNPTVLTVANRFLVRPLEVDGAEYVVPEGPGLGVSVDERALAEVAQRPVLEPLHGGT